MTLHGDRHLTQHWLKYLKAPSLYLNQCWLIINEVLWHSLEVNFIRNTPDIHLWYEFYNYYIRALSPSSQWVNLLLLSTYYTCHYSDIFMSMISSQITNLTIVYSTVYSDADQRKHQSSPSLAFVWGIHRGPVNSPHKWPVTRKMFPFDDVIMLQKSWSRYAVVIYSGVPIGGGSGRRHSCSHKTAAKIPSFFLNLL